MTTRQALHDLIDRLPDHLLDDAESRLAQLDGSGETALDRVLAAAPVDDEPLTPAEVKALERWDPKKSEAQLLTRSEAEKLIANHTS